MAENKPLIGLKWEPKLPGLSLDLKTGFCSSKGAERKESGSLWSSKSELVDGLCLPPTGPRKLNKMIRKQLKDTTGSNWFDIPAPTMTPELKRDLQLLKLRNVMDPSQHYKRVASQSKLGKNISRQVSDLCWLCFHRKRKVREIEEKNRSSQDKKWKRKGKDSKNTEHRWN